MHPSMERLFDAVKKSPSEVAVDLDELPQNITNWSKRGISKSGALKAAAAYGLDANWLIHGEGVAHSSQAQSQSGQTQFQFQGTTYDDGLPQRVIPVLSMVQAGHWTPVMSCGLNEAIEYMPWIKDVGDNGFGVIVTGYSMAPYFLPNDRLYVNPDLDPLNEDLVIAMCDHETEATFKQLIIEAGRKYLVPLNKDWIGSKAIELDHACSIKGVVVSSVRPVDKRLYRAAHS